MSSTETPAHPRIAIIGGGLGGLTLLLTLHNRSIPATLYEREASFSSRAHLGGTLDLGYDSGQRALRSNGLAALFAQHSRPEADTSRFADSQKVLGSMNADKDKDQDPRDRRPEIDRSVLRRIILDALPADAVKWGYALASVRPLPGSRGAHELEFANGHTTVCDILVGADGAYSRVRPLVSPAVPLYHGVTGAEISLAPETAKRPELRDTVELVGGCTRIPAVRQKIQNWFGGKPLSTTLNQDEAAARGATFSCAMLSPVFRVREFSMLDIAPYSVTVSWEKEPEDDDTALTVFPKGNNIPSTKVLTFYRKAGFDIEARYAEPATLPGAINPWIAKFTAKNVEPQPNGDYQIVKVKTRLNANGVLSFEQAYTEEIEEKEEAMQVDGAEGDAAAPKKKRVVKKHDVAFVWGHTGLDSSVIGQFKELENQMHAADKLVYDTEV